MRSRRPIAVLGAGITGCSVALLLARAGHDVHLFDDSTAPMSAASRWNEGKIHLGFLYAADPSRRTARRILTGGLAFGPLVEDLIGCSLDTATTDHDDTYVVHRDSVVGPEQMGSYLAAVMDDAKQHPDARRYLVDLRQRGVQRLPASELEPRFRTDAVVAGFTVPERSVSTEWLADRMVEALDAEARIIQHSNAAVVRVADRSEATRWDVALADGTSVGPFDWVVNATWQGRPALDRLIGIQPPGPWSHRYRLSLFAQTVTPVNLQSAVIAAGPFGDVKNYGDGRLYVSWYPVGLRAIAESADPPAVTPLTPSETEALIDAVVANVSAVIPAVSSALEGASVRVKGGWVYAVGTGSLADANATLHRRDRVGIQQHGTYLSVDTGKYSIGPWLATQIAATITGT